MWFGYKDTLRKLIVIFFALTVYKDCGAITNSEFNAQIRGYSVEGDSVNLSDVKTLQKQDLGLSRYADLAPAQNQIKFKDHDDSIISGSSNARGLNAGYAGHAGYGFDYEDPGFGHGYEYPVNDNHYNPHDYHHYNVHDPSHHHQPAHHGYGHSHYKYHNHGLDHKALLWPIAGIALLGAAAALVTNPVLLQLGVVSGKRRRRHVDDIETIAKNSIQKWSQITSNYQDKNIEHEAVKKRMLRKNDFKVDKRVLKSGNYDQLQFKLTDNYRKKRYSEEDRRFIPIPLQLKNS